MSEITPTGEHPGFRGRWSVALDGALLTQTDVALVRSDHDAVEYALLAQHRPLIVDTRIALATRSFACNRVVRV